MRGELIGVWSEMWRGIWLPLIEQPLDENEEGVPADIFCELYRELAKALKRPTDDSAIVLLVEDAVTLKEAFELSAHRSGQQLVLEQVDEAFSQSGATELIHAGERRTAVEAALTTLLGQPAAPLLDAQLHELVQDPLRVEAARRRALERIINDQQKSREAFENTRAEDLAGERALVGFLESVPDALKELDCNDLTNTYFDLLAVFIEKFSLRYDLCPPCRLCPNLPGVFVSLVRNLQALAATDPHLDTLMKEFENAIRNLQHDCSEGHIKTCIQKQVNLLEAIGGTYPGVKDGELGSMCGQIKSWPHPAVRAALGNLYGFASSYPGIRHGGNAESALRNVDMRDLVAISIVFAGFTPYLSNGLDADQVYRGA
ncbi:hypothetical protein F8E02_07915 [Methanoculleus sp. Wushi-C6]|uniref:Uncharacterized protein n=1 Tax=Methanoculleus caldifontis TaxID=2651577 RepID=A0ABU3X2W8_9EURY|nr:hypothetical protein [Methanoculleus sp. Wushi-C6]MDV2481937.1 hypothetical protein [Methanoculleus sp. Wushi-C6]